MDKREREKLKMDKKEVEKLKIEVFDLRERLEFLLQEVKNIQTIIQEKVNKIRQNVG